MSQSAREQIARPEIPRIVIALPERETAEELAEAFVRAGYQPHRVASAEAATLAITYREPAAVVLDAGFIRSAGFRFLDSIRIAAPGVPVIVTADARDEEVRLKALVLGAEDCLIRPFAEQEAVIRVRRAVERRQHLKRLDGRSGEIAARAEAFKKDLVAARRQLQDNVALLQRGMDFHQRLDPAMDADSLRSAFLRHLGAQLGVERLAFLAPVHPGSTWMAAVASWGLPDRLAARVRVHAEGEFGSILEATGAPLVVEKASQVPGLRLELGILAAGGFTAAVPMLLRGKLLGAILLGEARGGGAPGDESLRLAHFLVSALVPLLVAQTLWERERTVSEHTLGLLVSRLEETLPFLRGHSMRVARLAEQIGGRLGLEGAELALLGTAGMLHDVGRFRTGPELWSKTGPLTAEEWEHMRRHPADGAELLAEAEWPDRVLAAVRHHHEHWDGSGYPSGLRGEAIPLAARVLAVADAIDALTSPRPHREARSRTEALRVLRAEAGTRFDPDLVAAVMEESQLLA